MKQKRWMKTAIETAKPETTALPWQRGNRRSVMIMKRNNAEIKTKSA